MKGLDSIVVGVDFTPCSAVALRQALRIAAWSHATVHIAHVIDTVVVIELEEALSPMQEQIRDGLATNAETAWRKFASDIPGADSLPIEISINNRVAGILGRVLAARADLLVLGAFGDRPPDVGLGTLASACVRSSSTTDVLLARDTAAPDLPFRRIVAAVDFSDASLQALERAACFAAHDGAELHILHVFQAPWHRLGHGPPSPEIVARCQEELGIRLKDFCRPVLDRDAAPDWHSVVVDHSGPRSGIVDYATEVGADLIALGTHGRANVRDMLLGSTAEKVLAESACSILAVKPRERH